MNQFTVQLLINYQESLVAYSFLCLKRCNNLLLLESSPAHPFAIDAQLKVTLYIYQLKKYLDVKFFHSLL